MNDISAPLQRFSDWNVPLNNLRAYLQASGWDILDEDSRTALWGSERDDEVRVVLPLSITTDYPDQVRDAVRALSHVEHRTVEDVMGDITSGGSDTLSVRLTPHTPSGEAPLGMAHEAIGALKDYVLGAAVGVETDVLVLPPRRPQRAEAYASKVRMSTGRGSFIVRLVLPLTDDSQPNQVPLPDPGVLLDMPFEPYGRRVTTRMRKVAERATKLAQRVADGDELISAFGSPVPGAPNATELAALAALGANGDERGRYQIAFALSPLAPLIGGEPPRNVTVTPAQQAVLAAAAEHLRARQPRPNAMIAGIVVRLTREGKVGPGAVVIQGRTDDSGRERRIQVELSEQDYRKAIHAHEKGLVVQAQGDVVVRGTHTSLSPARSFDVLSNFEDEWTLPADLV